VRFGELLRMAKRQAVADGLLIGMTLVAFGDASYRVKA
jgi:hypothetical protein